MSIFNTFITNIGFGGIGEELKTKPSVLSIETFLRQTTQEVLEPIVRLVSKGTSRAVSAYNYILGIKSCLVSPRRWKRFAEVF